jgi:hypothetical protein
MVAAGVCECTKTGKRRTGLLRTIQLEADGQPRGNSGVTLATPLLLAWTSIARRAAADL